MTAGGVARAVSTSAFIAAACGPVDGGTHLPAPLNVCPDNPCSAYQPFVADGASALCNGGLCQVTAQVDYTLVISVPDTSYFAPSQSFVVASSQLFAQPATSACRIGLCSHLPGVAVETGQYVPSSQVQSDVSVNYFVGQPGALPVRVTYRPLIDPPSTSQPPPTNDATDVGMPLLPALAAVAFPVVGVPGPGGGPSPAFRAVLPPGKYERTISPEPPYDRFFPPEIVPVIVASGVQSLEAGTSLLTKLDTTAGTPRHHPTFGNITRKDGASFDGWTAYIRDQVTQRRLSTIVVIGASNLSSPSPPTYAINLNTNHHPLSGDALVGTDVVIVPPAGADAAPTLVAPYLAGDLKVPPYPLIPPSATVGGSVTVTSGSAPSSATLLFRSKKIYLTSVDLPVTFTTNLFYEARATATASSDGADVRYSIRLPRGEYDVIVVPSDGGAAKAVLPLTVAVDVDVQDGKNLTLPTKRGVRGVARVSDGRALAGAEVVATPSSSLAASGVPEERWPRLASTTTELDGSFVLRLDPGTYDITVRPADGSRLPWVVSPSRAILTGDSDLVLTDPIEIPAPIDKGLTLVDPQENPIIHAVVRAFSVPTGGTAYVEIGRALTDGTGRYELYLAGTPHP
jgi:hypothetical protein